MKEGLTTSSAGGFGDQFPPREPSSNPGLCVTVISTTPAGTTAALNAAKSLGKDLRARITLLSFEFVRVQSPLDQPFFLWDDLSEEDRSCVPYSPGREEEVPARICLCNNREDVLPLVLRRRALIVLGGKRRWLLTSEQKLERALRRLGHHVIFIDVGRKTGWTPNLTSFRSAGAGTSRFFLQEAGLNKQVGSRMIEMRDHES